MVIENHPIFFNSFMICKMLNVDDSNNIGIYQYNKVKIIHNHNNNIDI